MFSNDDKSFDEYTKTKSELEKIYDNIAEGIKIRSKCSWYQNGEKCTKFFLNLEKRNASNSTIKKLISDDEEVNEPKKICSLIETFTKIYSENLLLKITLISIISYICYPCRRLTVSFLVFVKKTLRKKNYLMLSRVWRIIKHQVMTV